MKLSKTVPARVETQEFDWCKENFTVMSENYGRIRAKVGGGLLSCYWCAARFKDGERIALAAKSGSHNVALCEVCADKLLHSDE